METKEKIFLHNRCIQLLEAIEKFKRKKIRKQESVEGFAGTFPVYKLKLYNDILIIDACILRLKNTYVATKKKL